MQVLWVLEEADRPGGVESVVAALDAGLHERGGASAVLSWLPASVRASTGTVGWFRERAAQAVARAKAARATAGLLERRMREEPDLVVMLDPGSLDVARHLRGHPQWGIHVHWSPDLILRPWRHLEETVPRPLLPIVKARLATVARRNRAVLVSAPFVVTLTPSHSAALRPLAKQVHEIPNPATFGATRRERAAERPVRVAYVGRLSPEKDPGLLLDALDAAGGSLDGVEVVIAGAGPSEAGLRARAAGRPGLTFLGWVSDPWAVLVESDVLVVPSRTEGVPLVIVEALAAGCSVVATDSSSGVRDVLADGRLGRIVPVGDPTALRAALEAAVSDVRAGRNPDAALLDDLRRRHDPATVLDRWVEMLGAESARA